MGRLRKYSVKLWNTTESVSTLSTSLQPRDDSTLASRCQQRCCRLSLPPLLPLLPQMRLMQTNPGSPRLQLLHLSAKYMGRTMHIAGFARKKVVLWRVRWGPPTCVSGKTKRAALRSVYNISLYTFLFPSQPCNCSCCGAASPAIGALETAAPATHGAPSRNTTTHRKVDLPMIHIPRCPCNARLHGDGPM
jgi:hypothetical protein